MITTLAITSIFVLDQDQALDFYVGKLGLEVATDVDLGFMRWLTVKVPGESREILLELPGPPAHDPATAETIREMVTKGASAGTLFFNTDDAYAAHAELEGEGRRARRGTDDPELRHRLRVPRSVRQSHPDRPARLIRPAGGVSERKSLPLSPWNSHAKSGGSPWPRPSS